MCIPHVWYVVKGGVRLLLGLISRRRTINRDRTVYVGSMSPQLRLSVTRGSDSGRRCGRF